MNNAFIQRLLLNWIQTVRERAAVMRYRQGYRRMPETEEELGMAQVAVETVVWEPWESNSEPTKP
jgi:hypothetical protein